MDGKKCWYKLLNDDGSACNGGSGKWSLPTKNEDGTWTPGDWMPEIADPVLCKFGYHAVDAEHLLDWQGMALFEMEIVPGVKSVAGDDKIVVSSARLLRHVETWNEHTLRLLACDYAEHVLPLFEKACPGDDRPRAAIETTRRYANGAATRKELIAAGDAARDAREAAGAARDAARAAGAAAWDIAGAAAWAARAAAWDAWDAGGDARDTGDAGDAEHKWQQVRLREVMGL